MFTFYGQACESGRVRSQNLDPHATLVQLVLNVNFPLNSTNYTLLFSVPGARRLEGHRRFG